MQHILVCAVNTFFVFSLKLSCNKTECKHTVPSVYMEWESCFPYVEIEMTDV